MRIELDGGSVRRLVNVFRDSEPLPGEKSPRRLETDSYALGLKGKPPTVAAAPIELAPRWQQFIVNPGEDGDKLLDLLKDDPVVPTPHGDALRVDLDRPRRP